MFEMNSHLTRTTRSILVMYFAILLIASTSVLQGYAESISRMQNSKPSEFNDITPSPMVDWTMSTNGWRPMVSSSIAPAEPAPTEELEDPPEAPPVKQQRIPSSSSSSGPPKTHPMVSRPPPPPPMKVYSALPMQSHHPSIDLTSYVEDPDETMRPRPRRQKKRPPFKTVDSGSSLGLIASSPSDPIVGFRGTNSDSPFIRHVVVTEPSFPRHRPHPSGLRGPAPHGPYQADLSQEMLPPTTAPQSSRPLVGFDGPPHLRGRPTPQHNHHHHHQGPFHGPSFYFQGPPHHSPGINHHHHMHQQTPPPPHAYPAVARPSEPLPGSLLRPHKDRLTDSSAFRTGGVGFQSRPSPVQWPDSVGDGRVHFSVTSTPLVEERPMHWEDAGEKPEKPLGVPQRGKPMDGLENGNMRLKPQREPIHGHHQATKGSVEEDQIWGGVGGGSADLHGPTKDPTDGSVQNNGFDFGPPPLRASKKPLRGSVDGKRHHQGMRDGVQNVRQRPHENEDPGQAASEVPREERPRPTKHRHNPNYRKKIENGDPNAHLKGEPATEHQAPTLMPVKQNPSDDMMKGLRGDNGGQRPPGVRKRRPKPHGNRQSLYTKRPVDAQETYQQQQEQYQPANQFQQQQNQQQERYQTGQQHKQQPNAEQPEQTQPVNQYQQQQNVHEQDQYQSVHQNNQKQNSQRHPQEVAVDQYHQQVPDQEAQPQHQEVAEPHRHQEQTDRLPERQPTEGQRPRKRGRRPSRIRKPLTDTRTKVDGENQLAPAGIRAEEQQVKWTSGGRPRPILRNRRPKPEVQPTEVEPDPQSVTAPAAEGEREYSQPSAVANKRPTVATQESTSEKPSYQVKEVQEESFTSADLSQLHKPEDTHTNREQNAQLAEDHTDIPPQNSEHFPQHVIDDVPPTAEEPTAITTAREEEEVDAVLPTAPARVRPQRLPDPSTTLEAATTTAEALTTTVRPTSSAYGIRSRIRAGSRPRFSVKDYRERLNRLSQLSGRGKNGTGDGEADGNATTKDITAPGAGPTGPGRERWYPGRRQQQTLQEQQQLQHQRLQTNSGRNDGQEGKEDKPKTEIVRDRYRVRAPALRQRPTAPAETIKGSITAPGADKQEEAPTAPSSVNRYRSRYGGRFTTTTAGSADDDVTTTTENPTSRRRGILTTYGMRRPLPLRVRPGQTTTTEAAAVESTTAPMTTTDSFQETTTAATAAPVTSTTEVPTTTTTMATTPPPPPTATTTEEPEAPRVVENEVAFHEGEMIAASASAMEEEEEEEEEEDGVELQDGFIHPGQLVNVGAPVSLSVLTESGSEDKEDEISPEQRVSDLTVWATTGQTGAGGKGTGKSGDGGAGLVTFSAVSSYPAVPYTSRLVTMATEDPVLPLEAFFFGPSASGGKSPGRAR